jgi:small nuclear ribonucleoprotein (snRNP)-like protein
VLSALQLVVEELEGVDNWLNVQINHISEIQANLHLIEDKSGTLETTWQNLNDLQTVVVRLSE